MEGSTAQQQLYRSMYFLSYHRRRSPEAGGLTDQEITRQALLWLAAESVGNRCSSYGCLRARAAHYYYYYYYNITD
jgi:hypothetical protein